jgi:hypothetical protein
MNNFSPGLKRLHDKIVNPGLKFCAIIDQEIVSRQTLNIHLAESPDYIEDTCFS